MKSELLGMDLEEELEALKNGTHVTHIVKEQPMTITKAIRYKLGMTQQVFANNLNVSIQTIRNWEQGTREPQGPAKALLRIVDKHPEVLFS